MVTITDEVIPNKELEKVYKHLNFCLKPLLLDVKPFESVFKKTRRLWYALLMVLFSSVITSCGMYIWMNLDELTTSKIAELAAVMNSFVRLLIYLTSMYMQIRPAKRMMGKIIRDRKYSKANRRFWPLIESYSKFELRFLKFIFFLCFTILMIALFVLPAIGLYKKRLPLDFSIPFLPVDGFSVNWCVNYAFQVTVLGIGFWTVVSHFSLTFLFMSHACFKADTSMLTIGRFGNKFEPERMPVKYWRIYNHSIIKSRMITAVEETVDLMEYSKMARDFIARTSCADTLVVCFSICSAMFSFKFSHYRSMISVFIIVFAGIQLLIYHYAGQTMKNKLSDLATSIYLTPWFNLHYKKQKDIFFMLLVMQNFKGFNGIFFELCYETFYRILDFSNSLFSVMEGIF